MVSGIIFDIREFAVHDGPGIRTTVFFKGCPLRCSWCHNPESQSRRPQVLRSPAGERTAGHSYTSAELALILNRQAAILNANEGGVTLSGGEPLLQASFILELLPQLDKIHLLLDTSGYAGADDFRRVIERMDLVYYDLKLIDPVMHRAFTGCDNVPILSNLSILGTMNVPFVIRVPLVPGVTDTDDNLAAIARTVRGLSNLDRVDLLPYNRAAGGKYQAAGMEFKPGYDEGRPLNINTDHFIQQGIQVRVA